MDHKLIMFGVRAPLAVATLLVLLVVFDPWLPLDTPLDILLLNAIPVVGLFGIALALFRRVAVAAFAIACLLALLFYINHVKVEQLATPMMLSDFGLARQFLTEIGLFVRYSHTAILILALAIVALLAVALWRLERPLLRRPAAIVVAALSALLLFSLNTAAGNGLYKSYDVMDQPWLVDIEIEENGLLAGLAASVHDLVLPRPEREPAAYSDLRERLAHEMDRPVHAAPDAFPDIVMILAESFFDPGLLKNIETCVAIPQWCEIRGRGISGEMQVPTYGGNTTRTEFEILTGVPYSALPRPVYPYNAVVTRPTASIAWWLQSLAYEATAIHTYSANFWRRHRALPWLGFDEFIAEETFGPHHRTGPFISDAHLANKIMATLEPDRGIRNFVFAISMESHGPWGRQRRGIEPTELEAIDLLAGEHTEAALALRQYIFHARNAVAALGRLEQAIQARPEPTLLIFFGDHLPALEATFSQIPFENGLKPHLQTTPYLALANFEPATDWRPGNSHNLGLWALDLAGLPLPEPYRLLHVLNHTEKNRPDDARRIVYAELLHLDPGNWTASADSPPTAGGEGNGPESLTD